MKFFVTQENLLHGLSILGRPPVRYAGLPILQNILISAEENGITLMTTNLEIGIKTKIRGKVEKNGSFTLDSRILGEYISYLPKETIEINLIGDEVEVKTPKTQTRIKGLSSDEFPILPEIAESFEIEVKTEEFKKALSQILFAAAHDATRVELTGILFSFFPSRLTLAATDSYRLAEKHISIQAKKETFEKNIIVPARSVIEMNRILFGETTKLFVSDNQIALKTEDTEFVSRLIDGNYPDYRQLIPERRNTKIITDRADFILAVKSTSLFCRSGMNDVHLAFHPEKKSFFVTAINSQIGENISEVDANISGDENEIVLNYKYLLDGLSIIGTEEVIFELIDKNNVGLLRPKDQSDYLYLIMPIRQ